MREWLRTKWKRLRCWHPWWEPTGLSRGHHPLAKHEKQYVCVECGKTRWSDRPPVNDLSYRGDPQRKMAEHRSGWMGDPGRDLPRL